MGCPRCHCASESGARSCAACGAPLLLEDDPLPAPLDRSLDLDRRQPRPAEQRVRPPAAGSSEPPPALVPGWRRAAAWAIDAAVLATASAPPVLLAWLTLPAGPDSHATLLRAAGVFVALLGFAYAALGHALMGATAGKRLLGLQVVGPDGNLPSLARSAARSGVAVLGAVALGAGVLMALFTRSHRALHDLLADTVVVRTP